MAIQWDSDNGFNSWLVSIYKARKGTAEVSKEATSFFDKVKNWNNSSLNIIDEKKFESFIKKMEIADKSLINFLKDTNYGSKDLHSYQTYLKDNATATTFFAQATQKAGMIMKSFAAMAGNMFIMYAVSKGIELVAKAIDNYVHRAEKAIEATEKANSRINDLKGTFNSHKKIVEDTAALYDKLSEGVDKATNKNINLSTDDYNKFLDINTQLAEAFPQLVTTIDENGIAILNLGNNGKTASDNLNDLLEVEEYLQNFKISQDLANIFGGVQVQINEALEGQTEFDEKIKQAENSMNILRDMTEGKIVIGDSIEFSGNLQNEADVDYYNVIDAAVREFSKSLSNERSLELSSVLDTSSLIHMTEGSAFDLCLSTFALTEDEKDSLKNIIVGQSTTIAEALFDSIGDEAQKQSNAYNSAQLAWTDFLGNMTLGMKTQSSFKSLDKSMQDIAVRMVSGLQMNIAKEMNNEDPYSYIRDSIISPLKHLPQADADELSNAYKELISFDTNTVTPDVSARTINKYIDKIAAILNMNPADVKIQFEFENIDDLSTKYRNTLDEAKKKFGVDETNFFNANNINTQEKIDNWIECANAANSATEAEKKYLSVAKDSLELFSSTEFSSKIEDLSKFQSLYNNFKENLKEEADITFDIVDVEALREKFGSSTKSFDEFERTLTSSSSTAQDVEKAFNTLVNEWIWGSGVLNGLNTENRDMIVSQLEANGVMNASAIITEDIAKAFSKAANEGYDLSNASYEEVNAFLSSSNASNTCKQALARLELAKIACNDAEINTSGDIDNIIALANTAGASRSAILKLKGAKDDLESTKNKSNWSIGDLKRNEYAELTISEVKNGTFDYGWENLDANQFKAGTGGNQKSKDNGSGSKSQEENSDIDWFAQRTELLKKEQTKLENQLSDTYTAYTGLSKAEIDRVNELMSTDTVLTDKAWNELIALADKADMSVTELTERVKNGSGLENKQSILERLMQVDDEIIKNAQSSIDTYRNSYESLVALVPEYRDKIEHGNIDIELVPSNLKTQISNTMDAYSKLSDAEQAVEDAKKEKRDHQEEYLSTELNSLDAENDKLEKTNSLLDDQINYIKASGSVVDTDIYQQQINNMERQLKNYNREIKLAKNKLSELDPVENSEEYSKLLEEVNDYESARLQALEAIEKKEFEVAQIPIDNLDKVIGMYSDITNTIENWGAELEASGKKLGADYYQSLIDNGATIIEQYKEQAKTVQDIMRKYDEGSDNWNELYSKLQSINGEISSMVQNLYAWNEALLQMPLDSIKDYSSSLQQALDGMTDLQSDYESVISAVTTAIQDQIDALQKENDLTNETYQNQINALQEQLDLLDKANEARQHQLSVEQALYELDKARNQKSTKVIRNGEITYESDSDAIRNAENNLADAKYELEKYNLQTQMDGLQEELDGINKTYDDQTEKLENISKKWSEIKDNIEKAGNAALANEYLGAGWQDKILSGNDADLYNTFKSVYESLALQKAQYEEQIESTENIYALLENYIASYKDGTLSYDQAMSGINDLLSQMNQKMSATDNLQNIFDYLGTANGTAANADAILSGIQNALTGTADELLKSMEQYNKNSGMISEYTTSWQQLTDNVASMKDILEEVRDALENASDRDDDDFDDDDSERHISRYNNDEDSEFEYRKDGIKGGLVGKNPSKSRETAMKLLAEAKLDSNEIPAILHSGEAVLNAEQQEMLMRNFAAAAYYTPLDNFIMPNYRSILTENSHANGPQNIEVTIGDVDVHGVKNVEEFINSMATLSGQALREQFGKTRSL
ncbi:hypothetical protein C0033_07390 [Clostridium sp. chh4-2]|uniref:hypothetical protein n=1 Tax=Clostridium sp. chh4-2 TaxID=2067550 RepID=UPI000CCE6913|nr:hypothetical protein [Clostridium sp. chh4-2]PNV62832.1 hypothetical protein C0033_07390 [Clostridium sp. chh4-2]